MGELDRRAGHLTATASGAARSPGHVLCGDNPGNLRAEPERAEYLCTRARAACRPGPDDDWAPNARGLARLAAQAETTLSR